MVEKNVYESLKEKYGNVASWAIWKRPSGAIKSNMGDVSIFGEDNVLEVLNPDYVFVGLNGSGVHDDYMKTSQAWHNFHSSNPRGHDYKLRYALIDTPYWGSYITDAIKDLPEVDSNKVSMYLKAHPEIVKRNMDILRQEIEMLGSHPVIIALGGKSYEIVNKYLGNQFEVKKVTHYSYTIGKEAYREHVIQVLSGGKDTIKMSRIKDDEDLLNDEKDNEKSIIKESISIIMNKKIPTLEEQLKKTGLDIPNNWSGDIRNQLIMLFEPLINGSDFEIRKNESDTTKFGLNLFNKDSDNRCMGFEKMRGMMFKVYLKKYFYEDLKCKIVLPEPDSKKSQVHMKLTLEQMWELMYAITQ